GREEVLRGVERGEEPGLQRLARLELPAGQDPLLRLRGADQTRQGGRRNHEAVLRAGEAEGGGLRGETDVAGDREACAAAVAVAVDRGNHGERRRCDLAAAALALGGRGQRD